MFSLRNLQILVKYILLFAILSIIVYPDDAFCSPSNDYVILIHGLRRNFRSMRKIEENLQKRGYIVINFKYDSTKYDINYLSLRLREKIDKKCMDKQKKIHFVTHSLGGIIVRCFLREYDSSRIGKIVMLSPPNKGSEVVDYFINWKIYKKLCGPSGQQLGTTEYNIPNQLGPIIGHDVGIITGDRSWNPFFSALIHGKDDGKVSIERSKVEGMKDFLVVHRTHTYIMKDKDVINQIDYFIKYSVFERETNI